MFFNVPMGMSLLGCALDTDTYQGSDVLGYIAFADRAINRFEQADVAAKRAFVAHVLFRQRTL